MIIKTINDVVNLGTIEKDRPYEAVFILENTANYPVSIESLVSSCECTIASISQNPIAPLSSAVLTAIVQTSIGGNSIKSINFTDHEKNKYDYYIKFNVV